MGLAFTIDTPIRAGKFGINSVVSIVEEVLVEQMRKFHCERTGRVFEPIDLKEEDARARRITAYLNLLNHILSDEMIKLKESSFRVGSELHRYFKLLADHHPLKLKYLQMLNAIDNEKKSLQDELISLLKPGRIDANIMAKADRFKYDENGNGEPDENSQALASLRGFARSLVEGALILSAGYNPRLYNYLTEFSDFYPNKDGHIRKTIVLKVSDFRSAMTQGKLLAKKGIWVSEFRIESGLNCGGHAFATDGLLMGPILEEFKQNRNLLIDELQQLCKKYWSENGKAIPDNMPELHITAQGGIANAEEHSFLLENYNLSSIGWGSPFLLVPEVTRVDEKTLTKLSQAKHEDYYLSNASPFGIPINNFKGSDSLKQRDERIEKGRSGSPCYKKELASNTEFTKEPICTASREYQSLKLKQLQNSNLSEEELAYQTKLVIEKECLCEGLAASIIDTCEVPAEHKLNAVAICPGPNLAWFTGVYSLDEMVDNIYGRRRLQNSVRRPHVFINELKLYINYYNDFMNNKWNPIPAKKKISYLENLKAGIAYYHEILPELSKDLSFSKDQFIQELNTATGDIESALLALTKLETVNS